MEHARLESVLVRIHAGPKAGVAVGAQLAGLGHPLKRLALKHAARLDLGQSGQQLGRN